jgi:hypothetical protein
MINHYRTLGVDPQADAVVIRSAYLALIRRFHPDKGGDEADPDRAREVTAAWDVLRDPQRRAAYDATRVARFQPDAANGAAVIAAGPPVRGGAAGRNLFLLLAAGTLALGWWAMKQPQPGAEVKAAASATATAPSAPVEPTIRPATDERASKRQVEAEVQPRLPDVRREPEPIAPVVLPPLPEAEPARLPVRTAVVQPERRATLVERRVETPALPKTPREERTVVAAAAPAPAPSRIDLAPLERHLQLLTDQSLRFGTEAKRTRLLATRETFLKRLRDCDSDACKRDTYLSRNAEVGEIMRN